MTPLSDMRSDDNPALDPDARRILARRSKVDAFVERHFSWPGTLHLHRAAIGFDILRAPANVLLSPILVHTRLSAWLFRQLRLNRSANWLLHRRLLLRTAVAAQVETAILSEFLDVRLEENAARRDRAALSRAILAAPQLREAIRSRRSTAEAQAMADKIMGAITE